MLTLRPYRLILEPWRLTLELWRLTKAMKDFRIDTQPCKRREDLYVHFSMHKKLFLTAVKIDEKTLLFLY